MKVSIGKAIATTVSATLACDMPLQAAIGGSAAVEPAEAPASEVLAVEGAAYEEDVQAFVSRIVDEAAEGYENAPGQAVPLAYVKPPLEFPNEAWNADARNARRPDPPYPCG